MTANPCPKCHEPLDDGLMVWSGNDSSGYISKKQKGMLKVATLIRLARACPNCGYVEMYLDPKELKNKISQ